MWQMISPFAWNVARTEPCIAPSLSLSMLEHIIQKASRNITNDHINISHLLSDLDYFKTNLTAKSEELKTKLKNWKSVAICNHDNLI